MLQNLNNTNGKGSNAVINKQIKDLQDDVSQLKSDVAQDQIDIAALDAELDTKVDKSALATEVETASLKANAAKIDTIESKDANDVTVNDNLNVNGDVTATGKVSATSFEANGVDIVNDYTCKTSCALADSSAAVCTANDALTCAQNVKCELDGYKDDIATDFATSCAHIDSASVGDEDVNTLSVNNCAYINKATADVLHNSKRVMKSFIEPTEKDATEWYHISIPAKFDGSAMFVALDENDKILFTANFVTALAKNTEGEHVIVYSTNVLDNFKQILVDVDLEQVSFITKAQIKRLYYLYDSLGEQPEPNYEIVASLSDFDYTPYEKIFDTVKTNQTVVLGNETSLNGGMTVVGTLKATIDHGGQPTIDTTLYVQDNIIVGYNCDTGSYETSGVCGGLITFNDKSTTGICAPNNRPNWVNGCPRSVPRKTACLGDDGSGHDISDLEFEDPVDNTTITPLDNTSDAIITERTVANYDGTETHDVGGVSCTTYPIKHLGDNSYIHGSAEIEDTLTVDENAEVKGYVHAGGDIRSEGEIIAGKDMVVHGNLFVDGTTTTTSEKQVTSTGDYFVAREGAQAGLSNTDYSGFVINNYNGNDCNAFIGADCDGEVRVGKEGYTSQIVYNDISAFGGIFYDHLTHTVTTGPLHLVTNVDAVELSNVVWNPTAGNEILADSYYHWEGTHYFGPLSIVNGRFDFGSMITDAVDIAALDALTTDELIYYNSVTDNELAGNDVNQPILTRNEKGNLSSNAILKWDSDYNRADATPMASEDGQVLVSCVDSQGNTTGHKWEQRVSMVDRQQCNTWDHAVMKTGANSVGKSECNGFYYNTCQCAFCARNGYCTYCYANFNLPNPAGPGFMLLMDVTDWYDATSSTAGACNSKSMIGTLAYSRYSNAYVGSYEFAAAIGCAREGCSVNCCNTSRFRFWYSPNNINTISCSCESPFVLVKDIVNVRYYIAYCQTQDMSTLNYHFSGKISNVSLCDGTLGCFVSCNDFSNWTVLTRASLGGAVQEANTATQAEGFRCARLTMTGCGWIKIGEIPNSAPATTELVLSKDWYTGQPGTNKIVIQSGGCHKCITKVEEDGYNNSPFSCIRFGKPTSNENCRMDIYVKYCCNCCNHITVSYCSSGTSTFYPMVACVSDACAASCPTYEDWNLHSSGHFICGKQFDETAVNTKQVNVFTTCSGFVDDCAVRLQSITTGTGTCSTSQCSQFKAITSMADFLQCKAYPVWGKMLSSGTWYKLDYVCKVSDSCYTFYSGTTCIAGYCCTCTCIGCRMSALFAKV